jgi:hypothetical protein
LPSSEDRESLSMPQRKLARVLPEPVGAQIRVLAPLEIASQPPACAGVGPLKDASNQRLTGALKGSRESDPALLFASAANPPILRKRPGEPWLDQGVPPANLT